MIPYSMVVITAILALVVGYYCGLVVGRNEKNNEKS